VRSPRPAVAVRGRSRQQRRDDAPSGVGQFMSTANPTRSSCGCFQAS
jgi:hypothetical protein